MATSRDIIFALEKATKNTLAYLYCLDLTEKEIAAAKLALRVFSLFFTHILDSEVVNND